MPSSPSDLLHPKIGWSDAGGGGSRSRSCRRAGHGAHELVGVLSSRGRGHGAPRAKCLSSSMEAGATLFAVTGSLSTGRKVVSRGTQQTTFVGAGKDIHVAFALQLIGAPTLTLTVTKARAQRAEGLKVRALRSANEIKLLDMVVPELKRPMRCWCEDKWWSRETCVMQVRQPP